MVIKGATDFGREVTQSNLLSVWCRPEEIDKLWQEHLSKQHDHGLKLFGLTCFRFMA